MIDGRHTPLSVSAKFRGSSPQQPFQEQNERNNQRHKRKPQEQRMNGTGTRAHHFSSAAKNALNNHRRPIRTKTASEQSSPNSEKSPRKLRELMKRNAGFMAKSLSDDANRAAPLQSFLC
jgi:hypothetical protein